MNSTTPKGLSDKVNDLSQAMLNRIGAFDIVWYASQNPKDENKEANYNVSYLVGGYEYSISKADKELKFSEEDVAAGKIDKKDMHGYWGAGEGYDGHSFHYFANNFDDKSNFYTAFDTKRDNARFRPFVTNAAGVDSSANPYAHNGETATFPQELDKQEDLGYTYSDMKESLKKIENLLDKYLVSAYQNDPDSTETNQLLFLKAKLQSLPDTLQKGKETALENFNQWIGGVTNEDELGFVMSQLQSFERFAQYETGLLAEFSMNLAALLPDEQKQELMDALNVVLNYTDHKAYEFLGTNKELLEAGMQLKNALGEYSQNLVTRFSAIDNTDILLNLSGDSKLQTSNNNSRHNESLIDTIRSKLKTTDDSILQKVMSRISNAPKSAEASA